MDNILQDLTQKYDSSMSYINRKIDNVLFEYMDTLYNEHYISENTKEGLWDSVKKFFTSLILSMKDYIHQLSIKIDYTIKEKHIKKNMEELRKKILTDKQNGKKQIEIRDFWSYKKQYLELNNKLNIYAKKFTKMKYTKTWQIEDDLEKFNSIIEEYSNIMENVSEKTIIVDINDALNFVEDELRGKSEVLKTLNDSMQNFEEMYHNAEQLKTKMDLLGADVIPKHVNFIRRIANSISSFVRRFTTKFIMTVTLLFAI